MLMRAAQSVAETTSVVTWTWARGSRRRWVVLVVLGGVGEANDGLEWDVVVVETGAAAWFTVFAGFTPAW